MPTLSSHVSTDDELKEIKAAAQAAGEKVGAYALGAVRERMRREGHVPGTPAHDIRTAAVAASEVVGAEAVLAALLALRSDRDRAA